MFISTLGKEFDVCSMYKGRQIISLELEWTWTEEAPLCVFRCLFMGVQMVGISSLFFFGFERWWWKLGDGDFFCFLLFSSKKTGCRRRIVILTEERRHRCLFPSLKVILRIYTIICFGELPPRAQSWDLRSFECFNFPLQIGPIEIAINLCFQQIMQVFG